MRDRLDVTLRARGRALALTWLAACGSGGGFPDAPKPPPQPDPGTFAVDWTLTDANHNPVTCMQVNATSVLVNVKDATSGDEFSAMFACGLGGGISGALPASTYDLKFYLNSAAGQLASAPPQTGIAIQPDMVTHLDPLTFIVF